MIWVGGGIIKDLGSPNSRPCLLQGVAGKGG